MMLAMAAKTNATIATRATNINKMKPTAIPKNILKFLMTDFIWFNVYAFSVLFCTVVCACDIEDGGEDFLL